MDLSDLFHLRNIDALTNDPYFKAEKSQGLPKRPAKLNSLGREVLIGLNTFHVQQYPVKPVHQWDITVNQEAPGDVKSMMKLKVWRSKTVQQGLDPSWLYDGNKLAW